MQHAVIQTEKRMLECCDWCNKKRKTVTLESQAFARHGVLMEVQQMDVYGFVSSCLDLARAMC